MHLTGMLLAAVPPFTEPVKFNFDERVNVLIGPNASGKSTLLLVLADHFKALADDGKRPLDDLYLAHIAQDEFDDVVEDIMYGDDGFNIISASADWFDPIELARPEIEPVIVYIGSVRMGLPGVSSIENSRAIIGTVAEVLDAPFSGSQMQHAYNALGNETRAAELGDFFKKAFETVVDACSKSICDEVIQDAKWRNYVPPWDLPGFITQPVTNYNDIPVIRGAGINTNDPRDFGTLPPSEQPSYLTRLEGDEPAPIYIGHLSSGTEGTLLWIRWLAFKMLHHYQYADGWEKRPAILLIDEIENHLHPTWQRRVIPTLLKYFPGLQIFATTHSPFVVAGLKAGQVHILQRNADSGVITASTNTEDIVGWTMDEILRAFMGVADPTDDATAAAAHELRQLRNDGPAAAAPDEERRQTRMQHLRRQVDRDLLAGGPKARRREEFAQQFAEALEQRRQAQTLNQDGG